MAISTKETRLQLRAGIAAKQADALSEWMDGMYAAVSGIAASLDTAASGTDYATILSTYIEE